MPALVLWGEASVGAGLVPALLLSGEASGRRGTLQRAPTCILLSILPNPVHPPPPARLTPRDRPAAPPAARIGDVTTTARYLDILQDLRVVSRRVPATKGRAEKSTRGLYQITDPLLRIWLRYVHSNQGSLDLGLADAVLAQRVRPGFDQFVSGAFEDAARAKVARLARAGQLGFLPERIGSWWDRASEVDVVAVRDGDGALLLGECKWSASPVGTDILDDLRQKAALVDPLDRWPKASYALFEGRLHSGARRACGGGWGSGCWDQELSWREIFAVTAGARVGAGLVPSLVPRSGAIACWARRPAEPTSLPWLSPGLRTGRRRGQETAPESGEDVFPHAWGWAARVCA